METAKGSNLHIVDDQGEVLSSFPLPMGVLDAFKGHLSVCGKGVQDEKLRVLISTAMANAVDQILPYHLKRPSEAQISYAVAIASLLEISVPDEVLCQRWAMHEFLDYNVPAVKAKQASKIARDASSTSPSGGDQGPSSRLESSQRGSCG